MFSSTDNINGLLIALGLFILSASILSAAKIISESVKKIDFKTSETAVNRKYNFERSVDLIDNQVDDDQNDMMSRLIEIQKRVFDEPCSVVSSRIGSEDLDPGDNISKSFK